MLNNIDIMGRLTRDPELRYTATQTPVASFTLAVDRDFTDAKGQRATDFIDCQAWQKTAEHIAKYFKKGQLCAINGRLQTRLYEDGNGIKRKAVEIVVNSIYFADTKAAAPTAATTAAAGVDDADFVECSDFDDSDLPF